MQTLKTSNIKSSIKSYKIEGDTLYMVLKTGQSSDIPAVRADDIVKIISENTHFDIKRLRFFDNDFLEL